MAAGFGRIGAAHQALDGGRPADPDPARRERRPPSRRSRRGHHRWPGALAVLAVIAAMLTIPASASSAATGAPAPVITDAGGNTYIPAAAWLEQTAIGQVLAEHQLPSTDAAQVMTWARDEVRAQEWLDLTQIISLPATQRSADEQAAYDWFATKVRAIKVAQAQDAVNEYIKWSGLSASTYLTQDPVNIGGTGGYCAYQPPGPFAAGTSPGYSGASSSQCYLACTIQCLVGASPPTPTIKDFETWGAYDARAAIYGTSAAQQADFVKRATGTAMAVGMFAVAAALPTAITASAMLAADLGWSGLSAIFPFAIAALAAESAVAVSSVVGIVILAVIGSAMEIITVVQNRQLPVQLHDALIKAEDTSTPLDLAGELSSNDGYNALFGTFIAATDPEVPPTGAPVAPADADQHITVTPKGSTTSTVQSTTSLLDVQDGAALQIRPTVDNWTVATAYQLGTDTVQSTAQVLRFPYLSWSGMTGWAMPFTDTDGTTKFLTSPVGDPQANSAAGAVCPLLTGTASCVTSALPVTLSTGTQATISFVKTEVTPNVDSISYGPTSGKDTVDAGAPISFVATGTDPRGLPLTYTWSFPWQCPPSYYSDPLAETGVTGLCVQVGNQDPPTVLHGSFAGHTFYTAGVQAVTVTATNSHGESTTRTLSITVLGDSTAPTVTLANTPATPTGANGWYTSAVHGTVVAADPAARGAGSSGVRTLACSDQVTGRTFDLTADGVYRVSCAANDNMGNNSAIVTDTVKIDNTPPTATESVEPGATALVGSNGWYRKGPVTEKIDIVDGTCPIVIDNDGSGSGGGGGSGGTVIPITVGRSVPASYTCQPSGLAMTSCPGMTGGNGQYSINLVADGSASPTCTATDKAGNSASFTLPVRGIDSTSPDLTVSVQPSRVLVGSAPPAVMPHPDDTGSGLATVSCDPAGTGSAGAATVTCRAVDKAGNTTSTSATYTVGYAVSGAVNPLAGDDSKIPVTVSLSDARGRLGDSAAAALAADCWVTVGLDGAAAPGTGCASYDTTQHAFTESVAIPSGSTGSHRLMIEARSGNTVIGDETIPLQLAADGTPQLPLPVILTSAPHDQTVPQGQTAAFAATALGTPNPTEQWQVSTDGGTSWSDISDASGTVLTLPSVATGMDGNQYRAVFGNDLGTVITPAATLTVGIPAGPPANLTITTSPTDQVAVLGGSATFTVASSPPPESLQWQQSTDGGVTWSTVTGSQATGAGPGGNTLTLSGATADMDGRRYRAELFSTGGTDEPAAITTAATLHLAAAPTVTRQPADETVGVGATASFSAAASGEPAPQANWQVSTDGGHSWRPVPGSPGSTTTLDIPAVTAALSGAEYEAVFHNASGTVASAPATLTVGQPSAGPSLRVTAAPQYQTAPIGTDATFSADATGTPVPTVQWQFQLAGTATWTPIDGAISTRLSVPRVGTDDPDLTGAWNADGTSYRAVFTAQDGSRQTATTDAATLEVATPPRVVLNPVDVTGAPGAFTAAASGVPAPSVQWQHRVGGTWTSITGATTGSLVPHDASGTAYRAVFSNPAGTAITTTATFTTGGDRPPVLMLSPQDQRVAAGSTATFTSLAGGSPAPTVQWQRSTDGTTWSDVPGATSSTFVTASLTAADDGTRYRAVFTSGGAAAISLPATLSVTGPDPIGPTVTTQPSSQQAEVGSDATFTAVAAGVPAPTVQWQTETDGSWADIPGATAATLVLHFVTAGMQGGSYRAVFSNGSGSVTSDVARLAVYQPLAVTTAALPGATAGAPYSAQLRASGGPEGARPWYLPAGSSLPPGLTLSPSGLLSGTPTVAGRFTFTVAVGDPAQATLTLVVAAAAPPTTTGGGTTTTGGATTTTSSGNATGSSPGATTGGTASQTAAPDSTTSPVTTTGSTGGGGSATGASSGSGRAGASTADHGVSGAATSASAGAVGPGGDRPGLSYTGVPAISDLLSAIGLVLLGGLFLLAGSRRRRRGRHA